MSTARTKANGNAAKPPRPPEQLIRGESADERMLLMEVQIDQILRVVEAVAGLVLTVLVRARDETTEDEMLKAAEAGMVRLDEALHYGGSPT